MPPAVLVFGTYDGHVLAFRVEPDAASGRMLAPLLGIKAHDGRVRSVSSSGRFAVSASSDETMGVLHLRKMVDLGAVYPDSVGVAVVAMHAGTHLLSAADDGRVGIYRASDWELLTSMAGHAGGVADIAIHPSGRLALTVGTKDAQLFTWNLMRAKCVLKRPLDGGPASAVRWSPAGTSCAVLCDTSVKVLDLESDEFSRTLRHERRVLAFAYLSEDLVVTGGEDHALHVWDIGAAGSARPRELCSSADAHNARIKGVAALGSDLLASVCSGGALKLWRLHADVGAEPRLEQVDGVELGVRVTCLDVNTSFKPAGGARAARKADKARATAQRASAEPAGAVGAAERKRKRPAEDEPGHGGVKGAGTPKLPKGDGRAQRGADDDARVQTERARAPGGRDARVAVARDKLPRDQRGPTQMQARQPGSSKKSKKAEAQQRRAQA